MQISQSYYVQALDGPKSFETTFYLTSSEPSIPIMPDSQNGPNLEKRREGDEGDDDNDTSLHASSRWLD